MKNSKFIIFFAILFFAANIAYSRDYHHGIIIEQSPVEAAIINNETASGVALAIAMSQLSFDWSTRAYQAGIGLGSFNGADAISLGLGKRVDRMLINGSIGREGDKYGYGMGISFHF
jgi:YadA-like membrane anchor domain